MFVVAQANAPRALSRAFSAVTALQFQGIALSPACFSTSPFTGFWGCCGLISACLLLGAVSLWRLKPAESAALASPQLPLPATLRGLCSPMSALRLCAFTLVTGYGALVNMLAKGLSCSAPKPMALRTYASISSDGASLSRALGSGGPSFSELRRAASDPIFAASSCPCPGAAGASAAP
jgi:hypothetical protein